MISFRVLLSRVNWTRPNGSGAVTLLVAANGTFRCTDAPASLRSKKPEMEPSAATTGMPPTARLKLLESYPELSRAYPPTGVVLAAVGSCRLNVPVPVAKPSNQLINPLPAEVSVILRVSTPVPLPMFDVSPVSRMICRLPSAVAAMLLLLLAPRMGSVPVKNVSPKSSSPPVMALVATVKAPATLKIEPPLFVSCPATWKTYVPSARSAGGVVMVTVPETVLV